MDEMDETDEIEDFIDIEPSILTVAQRRGVELGSMRHSSGFFQNGRDIAFWRRGGVLFYCIQGPVVALPDEFKESANEFSGIYQESGIIEGFEQAIELLDAWLIQRLEVDQLPKRRIRKLGIG